ncbi:alpha-glucosidase [Vibrio mimicus]
MQHTTTDTPVWWKEEVIYQIYPKSFRDSNNDGIGDIPGIIEKLDYLRDLGITMLWISPFYRSPMADNGYDISDYYGINPDFGTMADIDSLIAKADAKGIKIMVDLVVNHTSDEHAWFQSALADPTSRYRDYYIFKPASNGQPPNNWRSIFGGSAWTKVDGEETYYLHVFDKKQPDLNWENPALRQDIYQMVNWWLAKGVAGFRIDAITFIKKDQDYASVPVDGADGLGNIKHKARNRPGIELFLKELREHTFDRHPCVTVGEAPGVAKDDYGLFIGEDGFFNMIFDFHAADLDVENGSEWFKRTQWETKDFKSLLFSTQLAFQTHGWGTTFIENHDQPRAVSKYIKNPAYQNHIGAKCLAALYFFLKGTPFIYQGQEIGMTNFERQSIEEFDDISSIDNYHRSLLEGFCEEESLEFVNLRSRDNSRTPLPWQNAINGGFNQGAEPWLGLSHTDCVINVEDQQNDPDSVLNFYKSMIALRQHAYPDTLIYGEIVPLDTPDNIVAYKRVGERETIFVISNLSDDIASFECPEGDVLLNNYVDINYQLQPYQTLLIKSQ